MDTCKKVKMDVMSEPEIMLYCEDCLQGMNRVPDKSVDMILCDLPYGITANKKDVPIPLDLLWKQYERVIKDNGAIVLFGQGKFYIELVMSNLKLFRYDLVWDKQLTTGFLNANRQPLRRHEQIAVFYKKQPTYNPIKATGKKAHSRGKAENSKNQNYGNFGEFRNETTNDKYPTSIINVAKPAPSKQMHRTEKPVAICEWLIRTYTDEHELVMDNCFGSGATAIACMRTRRRFVGFEIDENYFSTTNVRLDSEREAINGKEKE